MSTNSSNIDNVPVGVQGSTTANQADLSKTASGQSIPQTGSEVPLAGLEPGEKVSFKEQVQGHAKMFAGKAFGNDDEVQKGAARITGNEPGQEQ